MSDYIKKYKTSNVLYNNTTSEAERRELEKVEKERLIQLRFIKGSSSHSSSHR